MSAFNDTVRSHFERPRHLGDLETPSHVVSSGDPVCGDRLRIMVEVEEGVVRRVAYRAYGCAPVIALGSVLACELRGSPVELLDSLDRAAVVHLLGDLAPRYRHAYDLGVEAVAALRRELEREE